MSITWNSVGHFFASGFHDMLVAARAISLFNNKIAPQEATIESLSLLVPVYGPEAALIERLAFAALGEFAALVQACGSAQAAAQKFPQADSQLLTEVEKVLQNNPQLLEQAAKEFNVK